ncbi:MAG: L,D-transpeptidase family protein [Verrucomicrobiales bacterium]|nr:L,D-transpeptidase family protein [Verrucomicrobiales bacterium]
MRVRGVGGQKGDLRLGRRVRRWQVVWDWLIPLTVGGAFCVVLWVMLGGEIRLREVKDPVVAVDPEVKAEAREQEAGKDAVIEEVMPPVVEEKKWVASPLLTPVTEVLDSNWEGLAVAAGLPQLRAALLQEDWEGAAEWLRRGAWVDERTAGGDTALGWALRDGKAGGVRWLLSQGADPNWVPAEQQPPLVLAVLWRQPEAARALIEAGADLQGRSEMPVQEELVEWAGLKDLQHALQRDGGLTPLMIAASKGDAEAVELLLAAGARDVVPSRREKRYAINFAATQRYTYIMQLLLGRRPGEEEERRLVVDLSQQRARLMVNGVEALDTGVSSGRKGYDTPPGTYVITNKYRNWTSTIYKVAMPRFMRLNCSEIGLHAGNVPGYPASHGCVRLPSRMADTLYERMRLGDVVEIVP